MLIFISSSGLTLIVWQCYMISHLSFSIPLHLRKSTRWSKYFYTYLQRWTHSSTLYFKVFVCLDAFPRRHPLHVFYWLDWLSFFLSCIICKGILHITFCVFPFSFSNKSFTYKKETSSILYWLPLYDSFLFWLIKLLLPIKVVFLCQLLIKNVWLKNYVWHVDHL